MSESEEPKILSTEEMDALLKVTQEKGNDLTEMVSDDKSKCSLNKKSLENITESIYPECEKHLTSFLRKKAIVKSKSAQLIKLSDALANKTEKHIFSVFKILPNNCYSLAVIDLPFLHQVINLLFGGQMQKGETVIEATGKVGKIVAEKIAELGMLGFTQACKEYGSISAETIKTVTTPSLITKLNMEDMVYAVELSMFLGEVECLLTLIVSANFLAEFIPENAEDIVPIDSESWRTAIEAQVVDSQVMVSVSLPEISIKASDLVSLKNGALVPIGDPTAVYVCLNRKKLFRGHAGQANANRVVKILSEM